MKEILNLLEISSKANNSDFEGYNGLVPTEFKIRRDIIGVLWKYKNEYTIALYDTTVEEEKNQLINRLNNAVKFLRTKW